MPKSITLRFTLAAILCAIASASYAGPTTSWSVDVPEGDLAAALRTLARDTGAQFVYAMNQVQGVRTRGAHGKYTAAEAVSKLLEGTGLRVMSDESGAMLILSGSADLDVQPAVPLTRGENTESRFRIAQGASPNSRDRYPLNAATGTRAEQTDVKQVVKIPEITVSAQKRDERAFDVPISIVAMSADELEKRKATSIDELSSSIPGLFIDSNGGGFARAISLRGVSNNFGNSSLIGLYLDEASVASFPAPLQPDLRTYDLARVEVLRGPQGTLYGEGSVGGTIRFITRAPELDKVAAHADVSALFTQDGTPGQHFEGILNAPVVDGKLGLRIAGAYEHDGGWIDGSTTEDFNDQNLKDVRLKALWLPGPGFAVSATSVIHRNNAGSNNGEDRNGDYSQAFNLTTTPTVEDDYNLHNLTLTYDFSRIQVLSATSYIDQDRVARNTGRRFQATPPDVLPAFHVYTPQANTHNSVFTEELRVMSTDTSLLQWTVGAFYRDARFSSDTLSVHFGLPGPPGTPLPPPIGPFEGENSSKSWAAFADIGIDITRKLTFGVGLRYFEDDQEFTSSFAGFATPIQTGTFDALNPRAYMRYRVTPNVNTYASAAKGFRSGGFNSATLPTYDPENVWTYELGAKMYLLDGQLSAEAALFYTDYTDYQIVGVRLDHPEFGNITSNAGSVAIKGVEWTFTWKPADEWILSFNGNYIDSEFYEIAVASSYAIGDSLDFSSKYGGTASAQRDFTWWGRSGFVRVDYDRRGRATFRNRSIGPWYFSESDIVRLLNANFGLQFTDTFSVGVFARNLLNDRGFVSPASIEGVAPRARPRTIGIEFGVSF